MKNDILLLHNKAINYRLPLFSTLQKKLGERLQIVFYSEKNKNVKNAKYLHFFKFFKLHFSIHLIVWLIFKRKVKTVLLWGANFYELPFVLLIAKLKGWNIVYWTENWDWEKFGPKDWYFYQLHSFTARHSDYVLYPGIKTKEFYEKLGIPTEKILFSPDASTNNFKIDESYIQNEINPSKDKYTISFIGRFLERKGVKYIIEAMRYLDKNQFELLIASGNGEKKYEDLCKSLAKNHTNIRFFDYIPKEFVRSFLSASDVFAYPSVHTGGLRGMGEPWGLILNEAVEVHVPIVCSDVVSAGYDLVKEGKNGFMVKQKDAQALALAIQKVVKFPKAQVQNTSKEIMELYSYENMANGFISAIKKIDEKK